jgi:mono/diheme cytochrome c family protein
MYAAYVWRDDESDAVLASESGARTSYEVSPGKAHRIPSVSDCTSCHRGGRTEVLGFSALQLSPDRDPLAPHREELEPGMATLTSLVKEGRVRGAPRELLARPPRIEAATPRGRAALGYLHANCSTCHDSVGPMASLGVDLHHAIAKRAADEEPALRAIGHPSTFRASRAPGARSVWIAPGSPDDSALAVRMASRSAVSQMPPLGSQLVDEEALHLIREWIEQDLRPSVGAVGSSAR